MRELDKLKEEKHDAVADVLSAKEEKEIADMVTGISNDRTTEELRDLRELRAKASPMHASVVNLLVMDTKKAENEFLEYAQNN